MCGGRVIPEIMYCDFLGCCGDEVFNQLPKWQAMSGNILKMPGRSPRFGRIEIRRSALAGLDLARGSHSRPESRVPGYSV